MKRLFACAALVPLCLVLVACPEGIETVSPDAIANPGSVGASCRPVDHPDGPCDQEISGNYLLNAVCVNDVCLIDCSQGGDGMCQAAQPFLGCSPTAGDVCVPACVDGACGEGSSCFATEDVCLPTGAFPSSPCRPAEDPAGPCDQDLAGVAEADMVCVQDSCVVDCSAGGAELCQQVNSGLTCSPTAGDVCVFDCGAGQACPEGFACFASEGTCLPTGGFPGSPCRVVEPACDTNLGGIEGADMRCTNGACVVDCGTGGQELCQAVSPLLNCSATAGQLCLPGCTDGACDPGFACLPTEDNCLPEGSFPGSPCRQGDNPCDQNVGGVDAADMVCLQGSCVIPCSGGDTALCQSVNPSLTCVQAAGEVCLLQCGAQDECLDGFECFPQEGACLPTGSFPGSPCRASETDRCDSDLGGDPNADMICVSDTCLVDCVDGGDALCQGLDASLACSLAAGSVCVPSCGSDGACDLGLACLSTENVCLPQGSFPGAPCRDESPRCDIDLFGDDAVDMICVGEACVVDCRVGGDATCQKVDESLTCVEAAGQVCLLECASDGSCDDGFSCFDQDNACLPTGGFPGSPCRPDPPECDSDLGGNPDADMVCAQGSCVVDCSAGGTDLCAAVDPSLICSAAAGGGCVKACLNDGSCADDGFSCFTQEGSCLPTGAFPSSPCRSDDPKCDSDVGGDPDFDLACLPVGGVEQCLFTCPELAGTGKACGDIDPSLTCAGPSFGNSCLPIGQFPGGPCRADPDDPCDKDVSGLEDADMECIEGTCVITCDATNDPCATVDASLACSGVAGGCVPMCGAAGECSDGFSCFSNENVCLPTGSFPGSPCNSGQCAQDLLGVDDIDMICSDDTCVIDCAAGGDFLCQLADPSLACSGAGGNVCVPGCVAGQCPSGFSCFESENTCLPTGAFPGSPCVYPGGAGTAGVCGDVGGVPMICADPGLGAEVCLPSCDNAPGGDGHALCQAIDPGLSCLPPVGSPAPAPQVAVCVTNGTFPSALCRATEFNNCDLDLLGQSDLDLTCVAGTCQVDCTNAGQTICELYGANLGLPSGSLACTSTGTSSFCAQVGCNPAGPNVACPLHYHCDESGAGGAGACLPYQPVHVIHTNDLHSHYAGVGPYLSPHAGGYAEMATVILSAQGDGAARGAAVLTLDGGDFLMGTLFHMLEGEAEFEFFKYIGYDAAALGNHEMDWGFDGLAQLMVANLTPSVLAPGAPPIPVLSANLTLDASDPADDNLFMVWDDDPATDDPSKPLKSYVVVTKAGLKVGILGLTGREAVEITPVVNPAKFSDLAMAAQAAVDELRAAPHHCDVVVAVSHSGSSPPPYTDEDEVVAEQVTGLDVIVSGHTHEEVPPEYINGTWVMQAGEYSQLVGVLKLGYVSRPYGPNASAMAAGVFEYDATPIVAGVDPDLVIEAAESGYLSDIDASLGGAGASLAPLVEITTPLVKQSGVENNLGNLIADANVAVTNAKLAEAGDTDGPVVVALEANGVIRDDILLQPGGGATTVRLIDAFAAEPLGISPSDADPQPPKSAGIGYPMVSFWLSLSELRQVLEVGATLYYLRGDTFWLNVSGMSFEYDLAAPAFQRVTGIWLEPDHGCASDAADTNLLNPSVTPDPTAVTYRVAANLYVASFAALLGQLTAPAEGQPGVLNVVPKTVGGAPITDLTSAIVPSADDPNGELRQWQALVGYLQTLGGGVGGPMPPDTPTMGRIIETSQKASICP